MYCHWQTYKHCMFQVSLICAQIVIELEHILSCNVIGIYYMPLLPVSATSIYIYIYRYILRT